MEMSLLEPEERKEVDFIWNLIPAEDKQGITEEDVLLVLDAMDDFLEEVGLLHVDEETGEVEYEDGGWTRRHRWSMWLRLPKSNRAR